MNTQCWDRPRHYAHREASAILAAKEVSRRSAFHDAGSRRLLDHDRWNHDKLVSIVLEVGRRYRRDRQQRASGWREDDMLLRCPEYLSAGHFPKAAELVFHRPATTLRLSPGCVWDN